MLDFYSAFLKLFCKSFLEFVSEGVEEEYCYFFFVRVDMVLPEVSLVCGVCGLPFLLFFYG